MEISEQFGKGCIPMPEEMKATRYRLSAPTPRVIDWATGYDVEATFTVPQRNQNGSSSCTAQATSYYCEALARIEHAKYETYSARFIYSQVFIPGGGAYIANAMRIPLVQGLASLQSVPEGDSSETTLTDASLNAMGQIEAKGDKYAQITNYKDIDQLAGIVEDYGGFVTGYSGGNVNGYPMYENDGTFKIPTHITYGHAVWVCGYELRNGVRCLKIKNSWTNQWGSNGYGFIPEEFVRNGPLFDAYVYADLADLDPMSMVLTADQVRRQYVMLRKAVPAQSEVDFWVGRSLDEFQIAMMKDDANLLTNQAY